MLLGTLANNNYRKSSEAIQCWRAPHRTGHGIGLDGHEWTYIVRGNKTLIQPGRCFNIEPTVVIYGEFGMRVEDVAYITPQGPKCFTNQSRSIDKPFG